jgi:heat shock protein HtpX
MSGHHDFSSGNRARIAAVIVLATLSYWLAAVAAAIATALTLLVAVALNGDVSLPDSADGWRIAGVIVLGIVVLAAVIGSVVAVFRLPSRRRRLEEEVLRQTGATVADPNQYPEVRNLLAGLAIAANVPPPRFAVIPDPAPNSFGVGTKPEQTIVAITTGLMDALTRDELEAVLAYEVSRIGSWDVALSSWTVALTSSAIDAVDDEDDGVFATVLGFVPRRTSQWLQVYAVKGQVRERDRIAIGFTRHPLALIRALERLHDDHTSVGRVTRATAPLWLEYPSAMATGSKWQRRLADELSLDGRIDRIRELAGVPKG